MKVTEFKCVFGGLAFPVFKILSPPQLFRLVVADSVLIFTLLNAFHTD